MITASILVFPNWKKEFHVHVDNSYIMLGVVLTQACEGEMDHPIPFASRKLLMVEKNYSTTECEGLTLVYALQKFSHYLLGGDFNMYIDHFALKFPVDKPFFLGGEGDLQMVATILRV